MPELVTPGIPYPMETMMAVAAKNADKFKCWRDLAASRVLHQRRLYELAEPHAHATSARLRLQHVQIDLKSNADALESGSIVGSGV